MHVIEASMIIWNNKMIDPGAMQPLMNLFLFLFLESNILLLTKLTKPNICQKMYWKREWGSLTAFPSTKEKVKKNI